MRRQRQILAAQAETAADAQAGQRLGVAEDDDNEENETIVQVAALPPVADTSTCPASDATDEALMDWVHQQREKSVSWHEIARLANEAGHTIGEDALRMRYKRRKEKVAQAGNDESTPTS
jgi:hypothetical protein